MYLKWKDIRFYTEISLNSLPFRTRFSDRLYPPIKCLDYIFCKRAFWQSLASSFFENLPCCLVNTFNSFTNPLFLNVKMLTKLIHFHSRNFAISLTGIFKGFVLFFVSLLPNDRYPHDFMNVKTQCCKEKNIGIPCEQLFLTKPSAFHLSAMVHHKFNFLQGLPFINFKAWRIYLPKKCIALGKLVVKK